MNLFKELQWRGFVQDVSEPNIEKLLTEKRTFYIGFDPTATSLQLGNLVPLKAVIHLAQAGLKPIILFGGATGLIGDPSGKSAERKLLNPDTVLENIKNQSAQIERLLKRFDISATFVNNLDWTQDLTVLDFLRDLGKHFTVNYMISKEVVKTRLDGEGISYTEFSYMLLQAFDFLYLLEKYDCTVQVGGSDQWGNITAGLELIRKKGFSGRAFAFSIPLLTDTHGRKFGKSESGAIWLDKERTSPYELHQFFLNREDAELEKLLPVFTFLTQPEIKNLLEQHRDHPEKRPAHQALADEVVKLVHGEKELGLAQKGARVLFGGNAEEIDDQVLHQIAKDIPATKIVRKDIANIQVLEFLVQAGLVKSKGEARRLIEGGGAYINNIRIEDGTIPLSNILPDKREKVLLRSGKKNYLLVSLK